jgi:hypothetical protein
MYEDRKNYVVVGPGTEQRQAFDAGSSVEKIRKFVKNSFLLVARSKSVDEIGCDL